MGRRERNTISKKLWKTGRTPSKSYIAVALCAVAIAGVVAAQGWGPPWLPLTLFFVAAVGPLVLSYISDYLTTREAGKADIKHAVHTVDGSNAVPPQVAQLELEEFGVHTALEKIPYLNRPAEKQVLEALESGTPVLILGPSMAGKSRMGAEVLRSKFPERDLIVPVVPDGLATLLSKDHMPKNAVIWLNDLERYISDPRHLRSRWLSELSNMGNVVLATMRETAYEACQPTADQPRDQWELLWRFQKVRLTTDDDERRELADRITSPTVKAGVSRYGLGAYIGGGYIALERFQTGKAIHPLGVALIQAAVGWQLIGATEAIPREVAERVAYEYLTTQQAEEGLEDLDAAMVWATEWCAGIGSFRMLSPIKERLRPFDYIVDHLAGGDLRIPNAQWEAVVDIEIPADRRVVAGLSALSYGKRAIAFSLFQNAAELGDSRGMANVGAMFREEGRIPDAEHWFERSAALGDEYGMNGLGLIHAARGELQEAERLYRQAGDLGYGTAISNLGMLLSEQGQTEEAERLYRQAVEMDNGWAMTNLGILLASRGEHKQAEDLYQRATMSGNPAGMYELGALLDAQGQTEAAVELFRQSADLGSPAGQAALGVHFAIQGQDEKAEQLLKRSAVQGDSNGAFNLGLILQKQRRLKDAKAAFRQASENGHSGAMNNLGILLEQDGRIDEAEQQYRSGAELGDSEAIHNLSLLLTTQARNEEPEKP